MTRKTFDAARDCTSKIKDINPTEAKIKEMFSFLSKMDRLSEICEWEGPSGIKLEAGNLPENTAYEKAFKEGIFMWNQGVSIEEISDYMADRYFEVNPSGYDAAIFFAAVFSIGKTLNGDLAYGFVDEALQYFLPDGWRWREEDDKEEDAHRDEEDWYLPIGGHRRQFLGDDPREEVQHRFDDIKVCNLIAEKDPVAEKTGKRIADRLHDFKDGALQLIMKDLTYPDLERTLYALPEEAEDRIMSNISSYSIPIIKGQCILNKESTSSIDIRLALKKLEEAINAYDGDPGLEAGYDN